MANERTYIRFPAIDIEQNATIISALVRFTAYEDGSDSISVYCYFEDGDDTTAPIDKAELTLLPLTSGEVWNITEAWVAGETYDSPDVGDILQDIISKDDWSSGNAVTFIIDDEGETKYRKFYSYEYSSGEYKTELIVESTDVVRLSPPKILPASGTYEGTQIITITCTTSGSSIYYTIDGSTPDDGDTEYPIGGFYLPADITLKAIAYSNEPGYTTSTVRSNAYELNCDDSGITWDSSISAEVISLEPVLVAITDSLELGMPYTWSVEGTGFTLNSATTIGLTNTLNADGTGCGMATITVTGCDGSTVTGYVRCTTAGSWTEVINCECQWCNPTVIIGKYLSYEQLFCTDDPKWCNPVGCTPGPLHEYWASLCPNYPCPVPLKTIYKEWGC